MTDTRVPEQWLYDPRWLRLSPTVRADALAWLVWSVAQRRDGMLEIADLELCTWRTSMDSLPVLIKAGIVKQLDADHIVFVDFSDTQASSADLAAAEDMRRKARERQRKSRAKRAESRSEPVTRDGHVTQQDRTGQDRKGQDYSEAAAVTEWATAAIPSGEPVAVGYVEDEVPW